MPYKKKPIKDVKDLTQASMMLSTGALALGSIGNVNAVHGQQGLANMSSFMPTKGRVMGAGWMIDTIEGVGSGLGRKSRSKKKKGMYDY